MTEKVDFSSCHIDPAPLQIMEGTPLSNVSFILVNKRVLANAVCLQKQTPKLCTSCNFLFLIHHPMSPAQIHNLFSLLSLQVAYVTSNGRLTGVVSLKDLRRVIESVEKGNVPSRRSHRSRVSTMDIVIEDQEEEADDNTTTEEQPLRSRATEV